MSVADAEDESEAAVFATALVLCEAYMRVHHEKKETHEIRWETFETVTCKEEPTRMEKY